MRRRCVISLCATSCCSSSWPHIRRISTSSRGTPRTQTHRLSTDSEQQIQGFCGWRRGFITAECLKRSGRNVRSISIGFNGGNKTKASLSTQIRSHQSTEITKYTWPICWVSARTYRKCMSCSSCPIATLPSSLKKRTDYYSLNDPRRTADYDPENAGW